MFEDSLVASRVGGVSSSSSWTALVSVGLQFAVASVVITLPLLHPEALPLHLSTPHALLPLAPKSPVPVARVERASTTSTAVGAPSISRPMVMPSLLPSRGIATNDPPPVAPIGSGMGGPDGLPAGVLTGDGGHGPAVSVAPARKLEGRLHVSSGVSQGLLLAPIRPVYPAIAKAARVEGSVVVEAVISKMGTIESLRVVSGPPMLQGAAIDAIRAARYQPYRLNGEATEVQTTITVNFRMAG
jgi:protein TonB